MVCWVVVYAGAWRDGTHPAFPLPAFSSTPHQPHQNSTNPHQAPLELVQEVARTGKLPVVNFAAGGVATPADAALMMQLGMDGVFVGSGIFKSTDPVKRARAIVQAVTHFKNPKVRFCVRFPETDSCLFGSKEPGAVLVMFGGGTERRRWQAEPPKVRTERTPD